MADTTRKQIELIAAIVAVLAGLGGMFGAFVLLPSRMEAAEKRLEKLTSREELQREQLIRLEETAKRIELKVDALKK